eukprot:5187391-Ditylum_brightwellii.AAC.1
MADLAFKWDEEEVSPILQSEERVHFLTNQGKTYGVGYFGWVAAAVCDIIIEAKGHALGPRTHMEI